MTHAEIRIAAAKNALLARFCAFLRKAELEEVRG